MSPIKKRIHTVLRWSERYTKTDMTYVASGGFWLTLGQGVAAFSGLLISVAFANLVSPETFGTYKYVISVAGIVGAFSLTGMGTAVTQAVARGFEGALRQGYSTSLKWGLFMTLIAWSGTLYYGIQDNYTLAISLLIVGVFQPIVNSSNLSGSFLTGKKAFKQSTQYFLVKTLFTTTALVATILFTNNPVVIVLAYFVFNAVPAVVQYLFILHKHKPNKINDDKMIGYSKHLSAMNILNTVATHIDKIVVFQFIGAAELAVYTLAVLIPDRIKHMLTLTTLMMPRFASHNFSQIKRTLWNKVLILSTVTLGIIILYWFTSPVLFGVLFPQYSESVYYSQLYSLSLITIGASIPNAAFLAHKKVGYLYFLYNAQPLLRILFSIFFAYLYGILGIILAITLARIFNFIFNFILLHKTME